MDIKGKIKLIMDTQTFDSGFTKREFVVTTDEQYPQDVKFETIKDKTAILDNYKLGDGVIVHFNIRGSEYQGKYFVNLQAWRMEVAPSGVEDGQNIEPPVEEMSTEEDDLPF
jgi:hypothetical protein